MNLEPLYITGPTASGKTALALALAERIGGEIVNADAFQLYRGLDICTAKPSTADFTRVPHHLYGVIALDELCDAQRYADLARPVIADIITRGKIPVITGGSGLYIKALTHGLTPLPRSEPLRGKLESLTAQERIAWLLHRDPTSAQSVNLKNDRHVTRALEICLLTSQPQSELRRDWENRTHNYRGIRLMLDRELLHARINQRVLTMIRNGLVEEIQNLPALSVTAGKAIGIREIRSHLAGERTLEEAAAAIQTATRQYARRQEKWFKREHGFKILTVSANDTSITLAERALALMKISKQET